MAMGLHTDRLSEMRGYLIRFWDLADSGRGQTHEFDVRDSLMDAANDVFVERDRLAHIDLPEDARAKLADRVGKVKSFLDKHDILMNEQPQQTLTGRTTYRILNQPNRFD